MLVLGAAALAELVRVEGYANREFAAGKLWTFHTDAWYAMALGVPEQRLPILSAVPELTQQTPPTRGQAARLLRPSSGAHLSRAASTLLVTEIFLDGIKKVYDGKVLILEQFIPGIERRMRRAARDAADADRSDTLSDAVSRHALLIEDLRRRSDGARAFTLNIETLLGEKLAPLSSKFVAATGADFAPFVLRSILDNWSAFRDAMALHALIYEEDAPIRQMKRLPPSLPHILHFNHAGIGIAIELLDTLAARLDGIGVPSNRTRSRSRHLRKLYERQFARYQRDDRSAPLEVFDELPGFGVTT